MLPTRWRRQTVERKARLIAQFKTGNTTDRTVADLGGDELGNAAAATKVVATGDPRYVEQVSLEDDVKRLSAMVRAHSDAKGRNAAERRSVGREVTAVTEQMVELDRALPALAANNGAPFAMSVGGRRIGSGRRRHRCWWIACATPTSKGSATGTPRSSPSPSCGVSR